MFAVLAQIFPVEFITLAFTMFAAIVPEFA